MSTIPHTSQDHSEALSSPIWLLFLALPCCVSYSSPIGRWIDLLVTWPPGCLPIGLLLSSVEVSIFWSMLVLGQVPALSHGPLLLCDWELLFCFTFSSPVFRKKLVMVDVFSRSWQSFCSVFLTSAAPVFIAICLLSFGDADKADISSTFVTVLLGLICFLEFLEDIIRSSGLCGTRKDVMGVYFIPVGSSKASWSPYGMAGLACSPGRMSSNPLSTPSHEVLIRS